MARSGAAATGKASANKASVAKAANKAAAASGAAASSGASAGSSGRQRRQLGRRSTEEAVDRAIAEHVPKASVVAVTQHRTEDGHSLRDRVLADM